MELEDHLSLVSLINNLRSSVSDAMIESEELKQQVDQQRTEEDQLQSELLVITGRSQNWHSLLQKSQLLEQKVVEMESAISEIAEENQQLQAVLDNLNNEIAQLQASSTDTNENNGAQSTAGQVNNLSSFSSSIHTPNPLSPSEFHKQSPVTLRSSHSYTPAVHTNTSTSDSTTVYSASSTDVLPTPSYSDSFYNYHNSPRPPSTQTTLSTDAPNDDSKELSEDISAHSSSSIYAHTASYPQTVTRPQRFLLSPLKITASYIAPLARPEPSIWGSV